MTDIEAETAADALAVAVMVGERVAVAVGETLTVGKAVPLSLDDDEPKLAGVAVPERVSEAEAVIMGELERAPRPLPMAAAGRDGVRLCATVAVAAAPRVAVCGEVLDADAVSLVAQLLPLVLSQWPRACPSPSRSASAWVSSCASPCACRCCRPLPCRCCCPCPRPYRWSWQSSPYCDVSVRESEGDAPDAENALADADAAAPRDTVALEVPLLDTDAVDDEGGVGAADCAATRPRGRAAVRLRSH